ncbi:hypothetical protein ASZ90_016908 [hydrocarbon metagenome]|uniref:Uncharacterized protein n=1 Tax=hydrocarbon metagenome TaxID=938273 RepID=A0A0W8EAJ2_9ZZZZ
MGGTVPPVIGTVRPHPKEARYGLRFPGFSGHNPVPREMMSTCMEKSDIIEYF